LRHIQIEEKVETAYFKYNLMSSYNARVIYQNFEMKRYYVKAVKKLLSFLLDKCP